MGRVWHVIHTRVHKYMPTWQRFSPRFLLSPCLTSNIPSTTAYQYKHGGFYFPAGSRCEIERSDNHCRIGPERSLTMLGANRSKKIRDDIHSIDSALEDLRAIIAQHQLVVDSFSETAHKIAHIENSVSQLQCASLTLSGSKPN